PLPCRSQNGHPVGRLRTDQQHPHARWTPPLPGVRSPRPAARGDPRTLALSCADPRRSPDGTGLVPWCSTPAHPGHTPDRLEDMVWLGGLITLLTIVLWVYAFFDALTCPAEEVRTLPKVLWLLIIVLFAVVGPLLWLFLGRPH